MSERNIGDAFEDFGDAATLISLQLPVLTAKEQELYRDAQETVRQLQWRVRTATPKEMQEICMDVESLTEVIAGFREKVKASMRQRREARLADPEDSIGA